MKTFNSFCEEYRVSLNERLNIPDSAVRVPRRNMPQVKEEDYPDLVQWLQAKGLTVTYHSVNPATLKPIQEKIDNAKVWAMIAAGAKLDKALLTTHDAYVIDGHHRWAAALNKPSHPNVNVMELSCGIKTALNILRTYPKVFYKDDNHENHSRLDHSMRLESKKT